jgi:DNA-binding transcriptional MerR regulator
MYLFMFVMHLHFKCNTQNNTNKHQPSDLDNIERTQTNIRRFSMNNKELKLIINEILSGEGTTLAAIAKKAKVNRANLSDKMHESREVEMRKDVVQKIANAYPSYFDRETNANQQPSAGYVSTERLIQVLETNAERYYNLAMAQLTGIDKKIEGVSTNLNAVLAGVRKNVAISEAVTKTALKSLARIEKKPEESLIQEADKTRVEALKKGLRQGSQHVADK